MTVRRLLLASVVLSLALSALALSGCGGGAGIGSSTSPPTGRGSSTGGRSGAPPSYTVAATKRSGGSVDPTPTTVTSGQTTTFNVSGNSGHAFVSVTACDGSSSGTTHTKGPADCTAGATVNRSPGVAVVNGQLVVAGTNTPFVPRGFTTIGVLYPTQYASKLCAQVHVGPGSRLAQYLEDAQTAITAPLLPGLPYNASFRAMIQDWHANSVRIHVSQGALQYEYANGLSAYTDMARTVIEQARNAGLIVIIDMQAEQYGCTPYESGVTQKLPDINTEHAWAQLLDPNLTKDRGVILEVFNEPKTSVVCKTGTLYNWTDWATGCGTEPQQGMLTVGQWLRRQAPNNVLLFDGDDDAWVFTNFTVPAGMPSNSAYTVHPFSYVVQSSERKSVQAWNVRFGDFEQSGHAVIVTAWDEGYSCPNDPHQTITNDFIQNYLPAHSIGVMGYAWDGPYWGSGYLVNSYAYPGNTPNYQSVAPDNSGCAHDGGRELQQLFQVEAAKR